jgi:hypothetical protein
MLPIKPVDIKEMPIIRDQIIWAASYLREKAEIRFRLYLENRLVNGVSCKPETTKVFRTTDNFLLFLLISYRDLNEARTAELKLNKLRQSRSFSEYLARFTGYAA